MIHKLKRIFIALFCITISISTIQSFTLGFGYGDRVGIGGLLVPGTSENQEDRLVHTIRVAINRVLGMLAFIALVLSLYAGFQMMTSGGDSKKYSAGFSILKNAGIGLAIIGVSWLIVSLVFYIINGSIQLKGG